MEKLRYLLLLGLLLLWSCDSKPQEAPFDRELLLQNFQNPPNEAKPRVWWHWMNGNITQDGIRKDLDWMQCTGIGGFQNFDANLNTPLVTDQKLVFMTPEWKEAFKLTTDLAKEKNLEMAIAGSPGWSVTGGPWVEPKDGMKKYAWSELAVQGGSTFSGKLPDPPHNTSNFQNTGIQAGLAMGPVVEQEHPEYYRDAAVIAYKLPEGEVSMASLNPKVTSSGGKFSLAKLTDSDLMNGDFLPPTNVGEKTWIQYEFSSPQTFKAYSIVGSSIDGTAVFRGMPQNRFVEVSDDGRNFRKVADIPGSIVPQTTNSIVETTAKYWRYVYETLPPGPRGLAALFGGGGGDYKPEGVNVAEFVLYNTSRVDKFEDKAGFAPWTENYAADFGNDSDAIPSESVVDLTDQMQADGSLNWDVPEGNWKIIRLGYSLTGRENHPASPEATGLEVDKLDEDAVRVYINHYLDLYKDATGGQMGAEGLSHIILDSYEAGLMNWTHDMPEEFQQRRGYSLFPWVPVLTGRVVGSIEESEKFLWDFRKTIGEMIAENHYDVIGEELAKRGMKRYTESHEGGRVYLADGMDVKRNADVPMSAMWTPGSFGGGNSEEVRSKGDIRESASVANIYGMPYVAAESMTSIQNAFSWHPEKLKRTSDMELASGLNRYVIHTSVHQPLDDKMPGFSLGPFGQYFTRQETWAEQAHAWISYLARGSYMLQQGKNVADILYLYGENDNITRISQQSLPPIPKGHEFDFVNATILSDAISADNGKLVSKGGTSYEMLMLDPGTARMTMSTLQRLKELADAGVKIKGAKPLGSPSLADDAAAFSALSDQVWSRSNVGENVSLGLVTDVEVTGTDHEILFRHRAAGDTHIYWLNNRSADPTEARVGFRVEGKKPELWHPVTGKVSDLGYTIENGKTWIELPFESWDAFFVVFIDDASQNSVSVPRSNYEEVLTVQRPWNVEFQKDRGAPASAEYTELKSWTEHSDEGIRHFSGTATYKSSFALSGLESEAEYWIDLGDVKNLAEVTINGQNVGVSWKTPYKLELGEALKNGENTIEIAVTNTWVNRLIGDATKPEEDRVTFTAMPFYSGNESLLPSGLLGEVKVMKKSN